MLFGCQRVMSVPISQSVQRGLRADAVDLAQVNTAGESMQWAAEFELGLMLGNLFAARRGHGRSSFSTCHTTSSNRRAVATIALCARLYARRLAKWVRK